MSSFTTWLWGTSQLDDAVDKATSELIPAGSEDIALNLEICDQIRSKSAPTKDAMRALKRRINHKNPNVQLLALGLTDVCVKNGGDHFLTEIASREFIDNMVSLLKTPALNLEVKNAMLRLVQNWAAAFEGKPSLAYVGQVYKELKTEGYKFPPRDLAVANPAMVDTQTAPEWIDSDVCLRCRTAFTFTNRKHHCRNCGQVFDHACSSKSMPLPHFGITQEVRVCDGCHVKLSRKLEKDHGTVNKVHHRASSSQAGLRHRSGRELEDEELQRAIQLSLQEINAVNGHSRPGYVPYRPSPSEPPLVDHSFHSGPRLSAEEDDPDLRAAIEASLREANAPKASAPVEAETPRSDPMSSLTQSYPLGVVPPHPLAQKPSSYDLEPLESDAILTFSQTVEEVHARGGRDMSRYPGVTELYEKVNGLRPKLVLNLDDTGRKEQMLSEMHDKLSQAVKLYDQLLTQQISQPRWRSSVPARSPIISSQQPVTGYSPAPAPAPQNDHQGWAPSRIPVSAPPDTARVDQPQSLQQQNLAQPMQTHIVPIGQTYFPEGNSPLQQSHRQFPHLASSAGPSSAVAPSQPGPTTNYQPTQLSGPPQNAHYPVHVAPASLPTASATTSNSFSQGLGPLPASTAPSFLPTYLPQSPPPPQQQQDTPQSHLPPAAIGRLLTRHNTVSGAPRATYHSRHNTIANTTPQQAVLQPTPAPTIFPQFPVAPTSAPQTYSLFGPSVPSGVAEKKEALLIDL